MGFTQDFTRFLKNPFRKPSSQPSLRPSTNYATQPREPPLGNNPSPEEYARVFKEAYDRHMPPYDFRVWDRYLFSRCTTQDQFFGLLGLYEWTRDYGHRFKCDEIAKWCMNGQFACRVKRIIDTAARTRSARKDKIKKDLQFLESNHEVLDLGPMNLSSVDDAHKETWFMQAKACVKLHSSWNESKNYNDNMRKEQEAYFAFGVVVWGITPKPNWVLDDIRFDVWYQMGFHIVHFKHADELLLSRYQKVFAKTRGIGAVNFFDFHLRWNIGRMGMWIDLKTDWECSKPILKSLEDFFSIRYPSDEPSVYRLYHLIALSDQDYHRLLATKHETVFDAALMTYWLIRKSENEKTDSIVRKNIYSRVMEHIDDPKDLDYALEHLELPEFVQKVYDELKMSIPKRELELIWGASCCW